MNLFAQEKVNQPNNNLKKSLEIKSLFSMFILGGFHIGIGYRYEKFRVRVSVKNGEDYNAEKAGIHNSSKEFKRHYKTSPGIFLDITFGKI